MVSPRKTADRRPRGLPSLAAAAVVAVLAMTGCGAGYGDPISVTDAAAGGPATTPVAPDTTATAPPTTTTDTPPTGNGPSTTSTGSSTTTTDGGSSGGSTNGGSGGSSGGGSAYGNAVQLYCKGFKEAAQTYGESYLAAGTDLPRIGSTIVAFGSDIEDASRALRAIPPPPNFSAFHRTALAGIRKLTSSISDNASKLRAGNQKAGLEVFREIQSAQQALTSFPSAILRRAPGCRALTG
ncbi:MAG: hypothetical protein AB7G37_07605 [Solirubrobacteraceae bacterium]